MVVSIMLFFRDLCYLIKFSVKKSTDIGLCDKKEYSARSAIFLPSIEET